jgi:hypothetical protein
MKFFQSKADSDVWMQRDGDVYEYITVYTNDLAIASPEPKKIIDALEKDSGCKLKGIRPIAYHLGCDYSRILMELFVADRESILKR